MSATAGGVGEAKTARKKGLSCLSQNLSLLRLRKPAASKRRPGFLKRQGPDFQFLSLIRVRSRSGQGNRPKGGSGEEMYPPRIPLRRNHRIDACPAALNILRYNSLSPA
jgi:hypothetical protein